jgi:hypothetical protein
MATAVKRVVMELRKFGPSRQLVSVIGQGTWYIEAGIRSSAIAALRRGLDLGMNHIDTAELYGDGAAEKIVGEAIAGRRDEVFLCRRSFPKMPPHMECCWLAKDLSLALELTIWTATFCTGGVRTRLKKQSQPSSTCAGKEKFFPGESAILMCLILKRLWASPARAGSYVIKFSTISKSGRLNARCFPGANKMTSSLWPIARSAMDTFPARAHQGAGY